jgi:hypothetical protein
MVRPERIPLDKRFPGKYAVNSLPTTGTWRTGTTPCLPRKSRNHSAQEPPPCGILCTDKPAKENLNLIPLPQKHGNKEGELTDADKQWRPDHEGASLNWGKDDKEQYLADRAKGWSS